MPRIGAALRLRPEETTRSTALRLDQDVRSLVHFTGTGGVQYEFSFDHIFDEFCSQETVFQGAGLEVINSALEGYNTTILTYGVTGAGKTFTMTGPNIDCSDSDQGLVMRTLKHLMQAAKDSSDLISYRLSILEIYNETIIDLLKDSTSANPSNGKLAVFDTEGGVIVPGLYILPIATEEEAVSLLVDAYRNRIVAEHQMNKQSSRSHVLYTFYITRTKANLASYSEDDVVQSKIVLVDLAGSERSNKSGTTGIAQKQANYINKSLSFLEQVTVALNQSNRDHIPYRSSKLTHLLKDSIGGNCNTFLIACIWPSTVCEYETLSTLRFATRMKCIENQPIRNSLLANASNNSSHSTGILPFKLRNQVQAAKAEGSIEDEKQKARELLSSIMQHTPQSSQHTSIPHDVIASIDSITQLKVILNTMKGMIWAACGQDENAFKSVISQQMQLLAASLPPPARSRKDSSMRITDGMSAPSKQPFAESTVAPSPPSSEKIDPVASIPVIASAAPLHDTSSPPAVTEDPASLRNDLWERYILEEGKLLHDSYQDAKETIKQSKGRQRQIVAYLNQQKRDIDATNERLGELGAESVDRELLAITQAELETSKSNYRQAKVELDLCKQQIEETQGLRQSLMAALLKSFEEHQSSM